MSNREIYDPAGACSHGALKVGGNLEISASQGNKRLGKLKVDCFHSELMT